MKKSSLPIALVLLLSACAAPSSVEGTNEPAPDRDPVVHVAGFRVPASVLARRARAGKPLSNSVDIAPEGAPLWAIGCADVESYADLSTLDPSSQQLFAAMVGGVCGQINFLTNQWFGGLCTAVCVAPGDWCDALKGGTIVDSSISCNTCAVTGPPTGPFALVLACAGDPNNTAP